MKAISYKNLENHVIEMVPEILEEYQVIMQYKIAAINSPITIEPSILEQYRNVPLEELRVGATVVLEDLLVPYAVSLCAEPQGHQRLESVFDWLETLTCSPDFQVRNAVAAGVCTALMTTYQEYLPCLVPHMGVKTKEFCVMQLSAYKLQENVEALFW